MALDLIQQLSYEDWSPALEPAAQAVKVVGWTGRRKGLPFITARTTPEKTVTTLREAIARLAE